MCFFSGGNKQQAPSQPVAPPPPQPVPVPADTNPINTADQKRSQLDAVKAGLLSTIKTGPQGTTGNGPELQTAAAGGSYAGLYPSSQKQKLG